MHSGFPESATQKRLKHAKKVPKPYAWDLAVPGYPGRGAGVKALGGLWIFILNCLKQEVKPFPGVGWGC